MKPGSVVMDLAAETGGNCELCQKDKIVVHNGVKIVGFTDLPSRLAGTSSALYANNITKLLAYMTPKNAEKVCEYGVDLKDDVVRGAIVTH